MFEAKLTKAKELVKIVESIKELITDAPFDCTENAMTLQAMDSSHVALVSLRLGQHIFEVYRCDRAINLGLSFTQMAKALKCAGNDDTCTITYNEDSDEHLMFTFIDEKYQRKQDVTIKLLDIDSEHLGVPDTKYTTMLNMSSNEFRKIVTDLQMFGDSVIITATKGEVKFETHGENGGHVVFLKSTDDSSDIEDEENDESEKKKDDRRVQLICGEKVKLAFSLKYFVQFSKASVLSSRVRMHLSSKVPAVVEFKIKDDGFLKFFLAPKIDDDDDQVMDD
ncbi:Proliferating cell nuclear antigen [Aphelenchoides besseyi]|nr:Proliferating cell nuclear antigen [Aphelenchoides besseyi]KAI6193561.1 Proliferating cell nuclear antigen [Aphelenchoides besseyi]